MKNHTHIVIMAGGTGTRFWPYSRNNKPKQFIDALGTGRSLLQMTFDRFKDFCPAENVWIVSNQIYAETLKEQLPELPNENILLEPAKKNTAPCIAYAAYKIQEKDPEATMVVLPSDQVIFNIDSFISVIKDAVSGAEQNKLITIGIKPNRPETGYGYIQFDASVAETVKPVKNFTEKPPLEKAIQFLESGDFVWNAGIFVWTAKTVISELEALQPELAKIFEAGNGKFYTENEDTFILDAYNRCESISIDYAVMEKSDKVNVILGDFGWSDLGSWNALHEINKKDENENVVEADALIYDSKDNFIINKNSKKITVVQGLEGYLVADFDDILLICKKEDSGVFRTFVKDVEKEKGEDFI